MPYEPVIPDGQHLGNHRQHDGAVVGHLFDDVSNKLRGHAAWQWVEPDDESSSDVSDEEPPRPPTQEEIEAAILMALALVTLVLETTPRVINWWRATAAPSIRSAWHQVKPKGRSRKRTIAAPESSAPQRTFLVSDSSVVVEVIDSKVRMSLGEWMERFHAMIAANSFADRQRRLLMSAEIVETPGSVAAVHQPAQLSPREFAELIAQMIESHPELLTPETLAELQRVVNEHRPNGSA